MKAFEKHLETIGNLAFVQFSTLEGEGFRFLPAGPAIESGQLVIKEASSEGVVNTLLAVNKSDDYFLLTDMDILQGAKQNRVVNSSVLIAPRGECRIKVSCVERLRWHHSSPDFKMSDLPMDLDMRSAKTASVSEEAEGMFSGESTQSRIWNLISARVGRRGAGNPTEDYSRELEASRAERNDYPRIELNDQCNGLFLLANRQVVGMDVFGNRGAFRYYFPRLREAAYLSIGEHSKGDTVQEAEAFFKLDDYIDRLEEHLKSSYKESGAGVVRRDIRKNNPGFELSHSGQLVHLASFVN